MFGAAGGTCLCGEMGNGHGRGRGRDAVVIGHGGFRNCFQDALEISRKIELASKFMCIAICKSSTHPHLNYKI